MARTRVNTTLLVSESGKNTVIYRVSLTSQSSIFWKTRIYQRCFAFIKAKNRFKKCKKCCNLQGFGTVTDKNLRKYQHFSVQKLPKHRYLQWFAPSTFSWHSKNCVNTSIFCDQLAKNVVIYSVSFALLPKALVFAVFCASLVQKALLFTVFSAFLHCSRKNR